MFMNPQKLAEILASHSLWLRSNEVSGERAVLVKTNLQGADLRGANLRGADLRDAGFEGANLAGANFQSASLDRADLRRAILRRAILRDAGFEGANLAGANFQSASLDGANLRNANLQGTNIQWAKLRNADLRGADFRGAILMGADFRGAILMGADLRGADLRGADLRGADLGAAILPENWLIVPRVGQSFTAFKKVAGGVVFELLIPGSAQRTSSLIGRKCRANEALVVGVAHGVANDTGIYESLYDSDFTYEIGKMASEPAFDPDVRVECAAGIHFFMTKEEAISYR